MKRSALVVFRNICFMLAVICILLFLSAMVYECVHYNDTITSAPLYAFILLAGIKYLTPAFLCMLAGGLLHRHLKHKCRE